MTDHQRVQAVLAELGKIEQELLQRHHIRLRVDKVTLDGRNALCSAGQVRRRFLRSDHTSVEGVDACHEALASLQGIGLTPFIGWLPRERSNMFEAIDPKDPFRLESALCDAGEGHALLPAGRSVEKVLRLVHHDQVILDSGSAAHTSR